MHKIINMNGYVMIPVMHGIHQYITMCPQVINDHKWGKICWAKLSCLSRLSRVPQKIYHEYLFILYNGVV